MDKLDFLSQPTEVEEPIVDEPIAEAPPEETVNSEPEPVIEQTPVAEEPKQESPQSIPLPTFLDMRDKLKAAERKAQELEARLAPPEPVIAPDVFEDPQGFQTHLAQTFEERLYQQTLAISRRFAEQSYGKEKTETAISWGMERCNTDPYFNAQVRASQDPIGFVVDHYTRDQIASKVDVTEFEQFQAWKAAQSQVSQQPQQAPVSAPTPPRSLASAPSVGGVAHEPSGPGHAFDSVFTK